MSLLIVNNFICSIGMLEKDYCILKNGTRLDAAKLETDASLNIMAGLSSNKFNFILLSDNLNDARRTTNGTNCDETLQRMLIKYSNLVKISLSYLPILENKDLSVMTVKLISALQDILNAYRTLSRVCYLGLEFFIYDQFLSDVSRLYFAGNLSLVISFTEQALEMDSSLSQTYQKLIKNYNFSLEYAGSLTEYSSCSELDVCNFTKWFNDCINFLRLYDILKSESIKGEKIKGIDLEWREVLAG